MIRFKKYYPVLIASFILSTGYAKENDSINTLNNSLKYCEPCCQIPKEPQISIYNQSYLLKPCGSYDFYVTANYLLIQPMQQGMALAMNYFLNNVPQLSSLNIGDVSDLKSTWRSAFKAGLGYKNSTADWDYFLEYTRINSSINGKAEIGAGTTFLTGFWSSVDDIPQFPNLEIQGKWDLSLNIFDLDISRSYYSGSSLIFKSVYGLKTGKINQKMNVLNFIFAEVIGADTPFIFSKIKSESWLIGPKAGISTSWLFNKNFSFFLNGFASLFYQNFYKINNSESNIIPDSTGEFFVANKHKISSINYSLESIIGFCCESYFNRNRNHFNLALGYEFDVYFNQNVMKYVQQFNGIGLQNSNGNYNKPGNLMYHGLNASLKLDF